MRKSGIKPQNFLNKIYKTITKRIYYFKKSLFKPLNY